MTDLQCLQKIAEVDKEEITMKIKYEEIKGVMQTPCPFKSMYYFSLIMVGSIACKKFCNYFKNINYDNQTVECNKKEA